MLANAIQLSEQMTQRTSDVSSLLINRKRVRIWGFHGYVSSDGGRI
jgi:hypothetical protein